MFDKESNVNDINDILKGKIIKSVKTPSKGDKYFGAKFQITATDPTTSYEINFHVYETELGFWVGNFKKIAEP